VLRLSLKKGLASADNQLAGWVGQSCCAFVGLHGGVVPLSLWKAFQKAVGVGLASHVVELGAVLGEAKPGKALSFVDNQILWWALVNHFVEPGRVAL